MPCDNGQSYSVSQNQIVHLPGPPDTPSVKHRVIKLESTGQLGQQRRKGLVLNLTNQFEAASSKPSSPGSDTDTKPLLCGSNERLPDSNSTTLITNNSQANNHQSQQQQQQIIDAPCEAVVKCVWDPGDLTGSSSSSNNSSRRRAPPQKTTTTQQQDNNSDCLVWTACAVVAKCNNSNSNNNNNIVSSVSNSNSNSSEAVSESATTTYIGTVSTSCSSSSTGNRRAKKEGDLFSAQLDKVFEREERREPTITTTTATATTTRDSPSRQSSWSSYDSAVVLENNSSVHSSWATLPSRNSSWGSYDMRPPPAESTTLGSSGLFPYNKEEIPWHTGTVKRTKQKLEESNNTAVKRVCTQVTDISEDLKSNNERRLSAGEMEEVYNPSVLLHYQQQSPTSRRKDSPVTTTTTTHGSNNREEVAVKGECVRDSPSAGIDIASVSSSNRQSSRLSTSAPVPSSLSGQVGDLSPQALRTCRSESETASPCVVNTPQCASVKQHTMQLEKLGSKPAFNKRCHSVDDSPESECSRTVSGLVKNLKKEFEAKSTRSDKSPESGQNCESNDSNTTSPVVRAKRDVKIRSLPSSPVISHNNDKIQASIAASETTETTQRASKSELKVVEDLSVKVLVGKYEIAKPEVKKCYEIQLRAHNRDNSKDTSLEVHPPAKSRIAPEFNRRSAPIVINHSSPLFGIGEAPEAPGRPPIVPSPSVVVASVVAKATSKKQQQQHGRTHPLARLQVRPRHNSPLYNTM